MHPQAGTYTHAPVKRRRKGLIAGIVGGVLALCCGGAMVIAVVYDPPTTEQGAPAAATTPDPTSAGLGLSDDAKASVAAAAGTPPTPGPKAWRAYIAALDAIDPDIVHGKEEKAVDRGRNQCSSVKAWPNDQAKLIDLIRQRFTSPDHPGGFGPAKGRKILAAVRRHICPTY